MVELESKWIAQEDAVMASFMKQHRPHSFRDMANGCQPPYSTVKLQKKFGESIRAAL